MPIPDFDALCDEFTQLGVTDNVHPAELHGLACGILAAGFQPNATQWLSEAASYTDHPQFDIAAHTQLIELFSSSQLQLQEGDFEFQLCLPDDELYGLLERSESLALWCQGFLHGFASIQSPLSADDQELLQDFSEISRLEFNPEETGESENEHEGYYAELAEFVRMATISLYMDHNAASHKKEETNHVRH